MFLRCFVGSCPKIIKKKFENLCDMAMVFTWPSIIYPALRFQTNQGQNMGGSPVQTFESGDGSSSKSITANSRRKDRLSSGVIEKRSLCRAAASRLDIWLVQGMKLVGQGMWTVTLNDPSCPSAALIVAQEVSARWQALW